MGVSGLKHGFGLVFSVGVFFFCSPVSSTLMFRLLDFLGLGCLFLINFNFLLPWPGLFFHSTDPTA